MPARIPLDVDLEDRLLYGLTPLRFGYLALAGVAALAIWSAQAPPLAIRIAGALVCLGIGAGLAWARWHDRSLDAWLLDMAVFLVRNFRVEVDPSPLRRLWSRSEPAQAGEPAEPAQRCRPATIAVTAAQPGAGARSVGLELAITLALGGSRVVLVDYGEPPGILPRLGMTAYGLHAASGLVAVGSGDRHPPTSPEWMIRLIPPGDPLGRPDLTLLVADREPLQEPAADHPLRLLLNQGGDGDGLPFDPELPTAQAVSLPLAVRCPGAPFSLAIGRLAATIREQVGR